MVSEKIKSIMKEKHITNIALAEHLNITPQSLSNKFYRDSWSAQDLISVLDFLDCQLVIETKPYNKIILTLEDI